MRERRGLQPTLTGLEECLALYHGEVTLPPTQKIRRFFSELLVELANQDNQQEITNHGL